MGRAWRWDRETLTIDAQKDMREREALDLPLVHSVSVFALRPAPGESFDETVERLGKHILQYRRSKWLAVTTAADLERKGFAIEINEPPPDHYDVILGELLTDTAIVALEDLFNARDRRKLVA